MVAPAQSEGTGPCDRRSKPGLVEVSSACDAAELGRGRSAAETVCALLGTQVVHLGPNDDAARSFAAARPPTKHIRDDESDQGPSDQQQRKPNDPAEIHPGDPTPISGRGPYAECSGARLFITSARSPVGKTSTKRCYLVDVTGWAARLRQWRVPPKKRRVAVRG